MADAPPGLPRPGGGRRRLHPPRDAVLPKRLAGGRGDGRGRLSDAVLQAASAATRRPAPRGRSSSSSCPVTIRAPELPPSPTGSRAGRSPAAPASLRCDDLLWPPAAARWPPQPVGVGAARGRGAHRVGAGALGGTRPRRARAAVSALVRTSLGSQHRPAGPTGATAALASLPDELDWLLSFLAPATPPRVEVVCVEDAEAMAAAGDLLRASADRLDGLGARPDFVRLDAARRAVAQALMPQAARAPGHAAT